MHQDIAQATLRVTCGNSSGSGFLLRDSRTALTNFHVVSDHANNDVRVHAGGNTIAATVVSSSPEDQFDFAILVLDAEPPEPHHILNPQRGAPALGTPVIFAGYPHGITDLLVQEAIVSGPWSDKGFYIDGSVNGGNSGGPIVEKTSGSVIGLVTQRRFLGLTHLENLRAETEAVVQHCEAIGNEVRVVLMGVNFGEFAQMMGRGFQLIDEVLKANANTGIAIGFWIDHADDEYVRLQAKQKLKAGRS